MPARIPEPAAAAPAEDIPKAVWLLIVSTSSIYAQDPEGRFLSMTMIGKKHVAGAQLAMGPQPPLLTVILDQPGKALPLESSGLDIDVNAPALFDRLS